MTAIRVVGETWRSGTMVQRSTKASMGVAALAAFVALVSPIEAEAAPVHGVGHRDMAWTVTDASGKPPPDSFGGGGSAPWAGADRVWNQPGFTGSYRITFGGTEVAGYCGDFHNAKSPDAASTWTADRSAFLGSDKALTKLSYAQWRWGATDDPDVGAAMNLYTHFLGSPGDRSHRSGVPIPDINDNDVLDEIVTTSAPHAAVAEIMYEIDAASEAWSAAFDHRPANVAAGLTVELVDDITVVTSTATSRPLPDGSFDLDARPRTVTATTAGVAQPLRDSTAGSQNSITAGNPQSARFDIVVNIAVTSQISDDAPPIGTELSDAIAISGLVDGETATVSVELFDLTVDPAGTAAPVATETRSGLGNGTTTGWAAIDVSVDVAGHRLGYRHRLESVVPAPVGAVLPGAWSELGIASETGVAADVHAQVHLRKTVSSSNRPIWINAQRDTAPSHQPVAAPAAPADGSYDDRVPDAGDGLPVFVAGDDVSFRYEVWLDDASTGAVAWSPDADADADPGPIFDGVVIDDAGTSETTDDFAPTYLSGDDGDGLLTHGEVWIFETTDQRSASAGERHVNVASVQPGVVVNPATRVRTNQMTEPRLDPAGYVVPCLSTSVADRTDGDRVLGPSGGVVIDAATYCNLVPGEPYIIDGVVMVAATGEATEFSGTTSFVPDTPDGTVDVEIVVDLTQTAGTEDRDFVVFQTVRSATTGDVVARHADIDDEAQTFTVRRPEGTVPSTTAPVTTTPVTTTPVTTTPDTMDPPPGTLPPTAAGPPSIPRVGSDLPSLVMIGGILLFTSGVVLMEARHGRIRSSSEPRSAS